MVVDTVIGYVAMAVACVAILVGAFVAHNCVELWLLEWRGTETTCTVLDVRHREGVESPGAGGRAPSYFDYEMDCAAADAPRTMTTSMAVPGSRVAVLYDPDGLTGARAAVEVEEASVRARLAGIATGAWTALTVGFILLRARVESSAE